MKFTCQKDQLDKQLQHISRVVAVRNSLPVLSNILLETDGSILRMSGTDLDLAVTTHLSADIQQEGAFTVPAKIFQEFIHQNPDDTISFNLESFELVCSSNKVVARIAGIDPEEFPPLPKLEKSKRITLPLASFVEAMKQVIIAAAADQSRPVLTGVYVQLSEEWATFAATDSFRLVEKRIPIVPVQEVVTILVPARTVQEIIRIAGAIQVEDIELEIGEQQIVCRIGEVELYSRLIVGSFPKYQAIIPKSSVAVADVTTNELVQALRLSYIFSSSGVANVMVEIDAEGALTVASYGSQRGNAKHTIYALPQEGFQPLRVPFNAKFLLDACQAAGSSHVQLQFSGVTSPLVIRTDDENLLQLVMPIRLDS